MKLAIISGSHRKASNSYKISQVLARRSTFAGFTDVDILDLSSLDIPFWNDDIWHMEEQWSPAWTACAKVLRASSAIILVTPEWSGAVPPKLKNLLLLSGPEELGHKPGLIVSVSSSNGGAYPVAELRMSGYKNNHLCFIPDHVIIRHADDIFLNDNRLRPQEVELSERIDYCLKLLFRYAQSLYFVQLDEFLVNNYQLGM